jgi:hypothetical protein
LEQLKLPATTLQSVPRGGTRMHRSNSIFDRSLEHIAQRLRDDHENVIREALPKRWVDLIHCLNELERKNCDSSLAGEAEAEFAVANQEKVLEELIRTDEPTEESSTLLETLRRKVARAIDKR